MFWSAHYTIFCCYCYNKTIISFLLTIDGLKKILELWGLVTINNNIFTFVRSPSGYGGNFSWSQYLLQNSLSNNYFSQMNLSRYNKKYHRNIYFIGLGVEGDKNQSFNSLSILQKTVNLRSWIDYYTKNLIK